MRRMIALAAGLAALTLPAAATAQPAPATTVQDTTGPQKCSVTAFGPQFSNGLAHFDGGTSCARPPDTRLGVFKKLEIMLQIQGPDHRTWFVRDNQLYFNHGWGSPIRIGIGQFPVTHGHAFRVAAIATLFEPNGHAGCTLEGLFGCYQQVTVQAVSPTRVS